MTEPTYEQKLKAVLQAYGKDYGEFQRIQGESVIFMDCDIPQGTVRIHLLEILLDTAGARATYGEEEKFYNFDIAHPHMGQRLKYWHWVCRSIHEKWHKGEGNNWQAALDGAFSLLPKDHEK